MKKGMFFALAASSLLFSACSSDDAVLSTAGQNEAVQQIVLQVASSGDGLTTRAGRPLYSSQALQTIQNVRVVIYNATTKTIVKTDNKDWKTSTTYNNHGRQLILTYKGDQRLDAGSYKVMAVGYSNNSDYNYSLDVTSDAAFTGNYSDITATLKTGKVAEEVFAGDAALTIGADKKITNLTSGEENGVAVTLHRQVAGSFGYFQNIPAKVGGKTAKTLRLVVRDKNDKLTFNNFNSSFTAAAGATGSTVKYYVNGSKSTGTALTTDAQFKGGDNGYVLYSINLDTWFPGGDQNNDGVLNGEDTNWKHPDAVKTQVVKGSVFGSSFVIPFKLTSSKSTMELQLLDADGNIIKFWTVSIPSADMNNDAAKGAKDESASIFNVVRNHMYNLGVKTSNGGTTDPEPGKPDPDPKPDPVDPTPGTDQPEDLSKSQNLILKVNDNWEAIHQMELGD